MTGAIAAIAFFLCGIVHSPITCDTTYLPRHLLWCAAAIAMAGILAFGRRPDISVFNSKIFIAVAGWIGISLIACFHAQNRYEAVWGLSMNLLFAITLAMFCLCLDDRYMVFAAAAIGVMLAGYGLYQFFTVDEFLDVRAFMSNRNLLSSALFVCSAVVATARSKYKYIPLSIFIGAMVVLFNRATILALIVAAVIICLRKPKLLAASAIILLFVIAIKPGAFDSQSLRQRFTLWRGTLEMVRARPVFGFGPGSWRIEYPAYGEPFDYTKDGIYKNIFWQRPHNEWLGMAAETGIAGGLAWLSIFVIALYYAWRQNNYCLVAGISGYMVIASFSFPTERAFQALGILALLSMAVKGRKPVKVMRIRGIQSAFAGAAAVLLLISIISANRYYRDTCLRDAWIAKITSNWQAVLDITDGVENYVDGVSMPVAYYRGQALLKLGKTKEAMPEFETAVKQSPSNIYLLSDCAMTMALNGRIGAAAEMYRKVTRLNPRFQLAANNLRKLERILRARGSQDSSFKEPPPVLQTSTNL